MKPGLNPNPPWLSRGSCAQPSQKLFPDLMKWDHDRCPKSWRPLKHLKICRHCHWRTSSIASFSLLAKALEESCSQNTRVTQGASFFFSCSPADCLFFGKSVTTDLRQDSGKEPRARYLLSTSCYQPECPSRLCKIQPSGHRHQVPSVPACPALHVADLAVSWSPQR